MREIVLDTETTGLAVSQGHRLVEIACIELENYIPTGKIFHSYIFPELNIMPNDAFAIHGLSIPFLKRYPPFRFIAGALLQFIRGDQVVMHNADFDLGFINTELQRIGTGPLTSPAIDTLSLARKRFPGAANSLDALARRFGLDLTRRKMHGALIDCSLLAACYLELAGGAQPLMILPVVGKSVEFVAKPLPPRVARPHPPLSEIELKNFSAVLARIDRPIWIYPEEAKIARKELDGEIAF